MKTPCSLRLGRKSFIRAELLCVPNMYMDFRKLQRMQTEAQSGPNMQTEACRSLKFSFRASNEPMFKNEFGESVGYRKGDELV